MAPLAARDEAESLHWLHARQVRCDRLLCRDMLATRAAARLGDRAATLQLGLAFLWAASQ
jgi:hypothetical protein